MNSTQAVSVIVPAYNEQDFIKRCLESLSIELLKNDEIIVVDNNSTDNTEKVVREYSTKDSRVQYMKESNQGTMYARKKGFDHAKGSFVATVDSDSIVLNGWRDGMLGGIQRLKVDAVSSYGYLDMKQIPRTNYFLTNKILYRIFPFMLGTPAFLFGSNMLMKRSAWNAISDKVRLEKRIWDDVEITILATKSGKKLGTVKTPLFKFSARRSLDSPKDLFLYTQDGRYTLSNYSKLRANLMLVLIFFTIGLVIVLLKPINYATNRTKSD